MQKTDFPFEVFVHDDASTDNTAEIIREFENKYPDIIKAVYQTENQYSKGLKITREFLLPQAQGEYIAICEGDDYWTDEYKLQKQYDFLSKNPEYSACVHNAILKKGDEESYCTYQFEDKDYTTDEIIIFGGNIFATNSLMMRKDFYSDMPSVFFRKGFGDYQLFMYSSICGKLRYMHDVMSVYNNCVPGSWTDRVWGDKQKRIEHYNQLIVLLNDIDEYYKGAYSEAIAYKINKINFHILLLQENYKEIKSGPYKEHWKNEKERRRIEFLKKNFKFLVALRRFIKNRGNRSS